MKQSGQKSKLCVRLIACNITIYGEIFCIFSRPSTYILDVAISEAVGGSLLHFFSGRLATRVSAMSHTRTSHDAENIFKLAISF